MPIVSKIRIKNNLDKAIKIVSRAEIKIPKGVRIKMNSQKIKQKILRKLCGGDLRNLPKNKNKIYWTTNAIIQVIEDTIQELTGEFNKKIDNMLENSCMAIEGAKEKLLQKIEKELEFNKKCLSDNPYSDYFRGQVELLQKLKEEITGDDLNGKL